MNLINRVKTSVGIDPAYDILTPSVAESWRAKSIFLAAVARYMEYGDREKEDIVEYALTEVWHAAKQYYAQHPEELHKIIVL